MLRLLRELEAAGGAAGLRLALELDRCIAEHDLARARALVPIVQSHARSIGDAWFTVYAGHVELRHRFSCEGEGELALERVLALCERAHHEDAAGCPQSVCLRQDLARCYGNMDGPGWAAERIAVCDEVLDRIDASWSCFSCLCGERAEAMKDAGRTAEALAWLEAREHGIPASADGALESLRGTRADLLLDLLRAQEALRLIADDERASLQGDGAKWHGLAQLRQMRRARALAILGRDDEALDALPAWASVVPGDQLRWLRVMDLVASRRAEINDTKLGLQLRHAAERASRAGAHRHAIESAEIGIRLALQRGATGGARRLLEIARTHVGRLRRDLGATKRLDDLERRISSAPDAMPPGVTGDGLSA